MTRRLDVDEEAANEVDAQVQYYADRAGLHVASVSTIRGYDFAYR